MQNLPSQSKILFIYDKKNSETRDSIAAFSKLFPSTTFIFKNIDCLVEKDVLSAAMRKRKCKLAVNCYSIEHKGAIDSVKDNKFKSNFLSFIRITDDDIEYIKYEILESRGFVSTGPIIGSRNIMFFKSLDQDVRSMFTDVFYCPSSKIDPNSLKNVVFIEKYKIKSENKILDENTEQIDNDIHQNINGDYLITLKDATDFSDIGPSFSLKFKDSYVISHSLKFAGEKIKNVKTTNQRKSGRIFVPKQDLSGLKLKKGIFKKN